MAETILRKELKEAFLQGIEEKNFFNGRLLAAEDLSTVQVASRARDTQLGQALGAGVAFGLEVSLASGGAAGSPPVLSVTKGLAYNRLGQAVALSLDAEVALAKDKPDTPTPAGFFPDPCQPVLGNGRPIPGKGAYLFVARPASGFRGLAPRRGFGQAAKVEGCDRDVQVDGLLFRLVSMDVNTLTHLSDSTRADLLDMLGHADDPGPANLALFSRLRNTLAHACLGTEELAGFAADPFKLVGGASAYSSYGLVDALEEQGLIDGCDVPLALVLWSLTGVKWVDMWAVRRRIHTSGMGSPWALPFSPRRDVEAEAASFQFQDQLSGLVASTLNNFSLASIQARDYFRFLPAAGLVPLRFDTNRGFELLNFATGLTIRDREALQGLPFPDRFFIEGARLESLLRSALFYPPIDLQNGELIWLYLVRQNKQAIDQQSSRPAAYLVFANGQMPYLGDARYDLSHWGYSNYALAS